ncbi:MAG: TauD/TfdA family dioxygenase [Burkholderiaceae bacterium]
MNPSSQSEAMREAAHAAFIAAPAHIDGPAGWMGAEMAAHPGRWKIELTDREIAQIDAAIRGAVESGQDLADISPATFRLPLLVGRLESLEQQLLAGPGFALVRGFPVARYSTREAAIAYLGIGSHLGSFRSQNAKGHLLGHVIDLGADIKDPGTRYYQTNRGLEFHTDSCDIVGLLCLRSARSGGESRIVSSVSLYNEMRANHPALCEALFGAFPTDRRGEIPVGASPWFDMPVFHWFDGRLTTIYAGQYIRSAQDLFPEARRLTDTELAAIAKLDELANDRRFSLTMDFRPGDMQFLHNHQILHAREDFEDHAGRDKRRHLLRLWLSPARGRALPSVFATRYGSLEPGARGGIITEQTQLKFVLEPQ